MGKIESTKTHIVDSDSHLSNSFGTSDDTIVETKSQLVEYLESGCKPLELFRLGAEQEQFVYQSGNYQPAEYDGSEIGIKALLEGLTQFGWEPVYENEQPIALVRDGCSITLEPGGQLELSGAPLKDTHQIFEETRSYLGELASLMKELRLTFLSIGHQPKYSREQIPWMPKQRYKIMREWMPKRGPLGLDMMQCTCGMQVNLDFSSEADMVKKFRVALALQPVATALFANSPFKLGSFSGYRSYRSHVWSHTDPDRCSALPFVFEAGMGFERYADYALDVPMYFVVRDGSYIDASGLSFRDFLDGRLAALPGQKPLLVDWANHLSTIFPQVRMKKYLEMRGADAGNALSRVPALTALWAGLLYDSEALDAAWEYISDWTPADHLQLESGVAKHGFQTPFRERTVQELSLWALDLATHGLRRRNKLDSQGLDESRYLGPLRLAAESGITSADELLGRFEKQWHADINVALPILCAETIS